jgi:hypothetical protein
VDELERLRRRMDELGEGRDRDDVSDIVLQVSEVLDGEGESLLSLRAMSRDQVPRRVSNRQRAVEGSRLTTDSALPR